ncbi:MAG: hypothetical protein OEY43_08195 [Gammaproteobacteria bacterium]|nr:hypothetical protein [Gammaproteobacteria bacterium]
MTHSIAVINTLLVDIKTVNHALLLRLKQIGFNTTQRLGEEDEYSVKSLINCSDNLAIQFLTITASRNQFIQRTSFSERKEIISYLQGLFSCMKQTRNTLELFNLNKYKIIHDKTLCYTNETGEEELLPLVRALDYIDLLKPYSRMLELVTAQERIHALSAVLETLLNKDVSAGLVHQQQDHELTDEQTNALELSHYLVKQAL